MEIYFIIFGLLWASAFSEYILKKKHAIYFSIIIAYFFTAFRFETGNDWPMYARIFDNVSPIFSSSINELLINAKTFNKELLFVLYNSVMKQVWGEFQVIIVVTTTLYFFTFFKFLEAIKAQRATVFAASFSWLIFSLYFSTLSQSMAISFFLLFWVSRINLQNRMAFVWAALAILFQVSSIIYFIVYLLSKKIPSRKILLIGWVLILLIILGQIDIAGKLIELVLSILSSVGFSGISNKVSYYLFDRGLILNTFDQAFVLLSTLLIGGWLLFKKNLSKKMALPELYGFAIYFIFFQGLFISHVVFRYRLLYVAFPIIFMILYSTYNHSKLVTRSTLLALSFMVSITYGVLYLNKRDAITFVPYQNYLYLRIFGDLDESTGLERSRKMLDSIKRSN